MQENERELGWDSQIQQENSFVLLPAGDYSFKIKKFDRARHEGSEKIPPCPKAIVEFEVFDNFGNSASLIENYLLHTKMEWKLSELFAAVGLKKKGEPVVMNWSALPGKSGVCKVVMNTYKKDGVERTNNRIEKLYPAWEQPAGAAAATQNSQYPNTVQAGIPNAYATPVQQYQPQQQAIPNMPGGYPQNYTPFK